MYNMPRIQYFIDCTRQMLELVVVAVRFLMAQHICALSSVAL